MQQQSGNARRQGRVVSHPLPRRFTKGPLDEDDGPLAAPPPQAVSPQTGASRELSPPVQAIRQSLPPSPLNDPTTRSSSISNVDLRFLQDRGICHPLPTADVPEAFLKSDTQPAPDMPLSRLVQHGHFRRAAETAANDLVDCASTDADAIFRLLYTRLSCLVLISRPDLAVKETFPLNEVLARDSAEAGDLLALVPWELRLLLVRLQSIGAADGGRRGIMALYALASEVRVRLKVAQADDDDAAYQLWSVRLTDLGLRTADTLVEMGELETATRHLDTLINADPADIAYRKALLRLRVGDVEGAKRTISRVGPGNEKLAALDGLVAVTEGDFSAACTKWDHLTRQHDPVSEMFAQNLAVSMLYAGQILNARRVLDELIEKSPPFAGLLFNLSTVYELCTERATDEKRALVLRVAAKQPTPATEGWERANVEFKL